MGLYNALITTKKEYYKLIALEKKYSFYSIGEISRILKILLKSYEMEEYQARVVDNKLLIVPLDRKSLSLRLKFNVNNMLDSKHDKVVISSDSINNYLFINYFQRNMSINYIQKFFRDLAIDLLII